DLAPPPLHEQYPDVPRVFSDAVARLLQKDPEQRYPSADQVHEVLVGYLARAHQGGSLESLSGVSRARPAPRPRRRRPLALAACAVLPLRALLVGAGVWLGRGGGAVSSGAQDSSRAEAPSLPPPQPGEVLTVAQAGGARFRDLREALARAGPGTTIRI